MNPQTTPTFGANGHTTFGDIFALTDEQILEVAPEPAGASKSQDVDVAEGASPAFLPSSTEQAVSLPESAADAAAQPSSTGNTAAAPAPFSNPEDLRAVAELYPGGLTQAKTASERARLLDDIDRAYFGAQGSTPEQTRASRAQLAAAMLREDPAAFREMVFEGLRALEKAGHSNTSVAAVLRPRGLDANGVQVVPLGNASQDSPASAISPTQQNTPPSKEGGYNTVSNASPSVGAQHAAPQLGNTSPNEAHLVAYTAFEKAANADLEKSVGGAIDRALQHALPNLGEADRSSFTGAQHAAPLQKRLSQAIRDDVEKALQGDRQLGEQIAQILAGRRFDNETRAQVVRLINDRAQQLVPVAAKRALNDWTQATLAAHRSQTSRADAAASRREVPVAATVPRDAKLGQQNSAHRSAQNEPRSARTRVNYGKLSDEQILDL